MNDLDNEFVYLPLSSVKIISPSRFSQFQLCSLKEIWSSNHQVSLLPSHPSARLGTISHAVLEATAKGAVTDKASFDVQWDDVTREVEGEMLQRQIEEHLVPLELSSFNYEVKKILSFKMAEQIFDSSGQRASGKQCAEQWFESADGKIGGKIDLILHHDDGVEIIDYKTGNVLDAQSGSEVKDEYKVQMKLYAGLYYEVKGDWPVKLSLIGIDRQKYYVSFSQEECAELLEEARRIIDETNELIEAGLKPEDFANPSPSACRYCSYRPACKKYWQSRNHSDKWPVDVLGKVKEKTVLGNGFCRVSISNNGVECVIRGLSVKRHKFLNEDVNDVLFCDLRQDTLDNYYTEQLLTTGYLLNNEKKQA